MFKISLHQNMYEMWIVKVKNMLKIKICPMKSKTNIYHPISRPWEKKLRDKNYALERLKWNHQTNFESNITREKYSISIIIFFHSPYLIKPYIHICIIIEEFQLNILRYKKNTKYLPSPVPYHLHRRSKTSRWWKQPDKNSSTPHSRVFINSLKNAISKNIAQNSVYSSPLSQTNVNKTNITPFENNKVKYWIFPKEKQHWEKKLSPFDTPAVCREKYHPKKILPQSHRIYLVNSLTWVNESTVFRPQCLHLNVNDMRSSSAVTMTSGCEPRPCGSEFIYEGPSGGLNFCSYCPQRITGYWSKSGLNSRNNKNAL